ncbi:MAG TPA: hypothetical protein VHP30_08400, partial [Ignavibacteriales bacterium]|nr:hypothetical protein [Ignavibacteriales bacterium]
MKALMRISICLVLILLTSAMTLATPLISEPGKFALYGAANYFTGGDINGKEIGNFSSGGMGFVIPIVKEISLGYKYGSNGSADNHYSLEGTLFTREYLFKLNFDKCGSEGSITHLGVFRDFDGTDFWHLCMGGGLALVNIS